MFNKIVVILFLFTLCSCGGSEDGTILDLPEGQYNSKQLTNDGVQSSIVFATCKSSGSTCTSNGQQGKCTNINNCQSAIDAIEQKMHPPICSFQGTTPIVCCLSCAHAQNTIVRSLDPFVDFTEDPRYNKSSKARDNCFKYLKTLRYPCSFPPVRFNEAGDRILSDECFSFIDHTPFEATAHYSGKRKRETGQQPFDDDQDGTEPQISLGREAYRRQYPHMALLGYGDNMETAQLLCGGSVISEKYILTAGHCISSPTAGPVRFAAVGILKRTDNPEYWQIHNVTTIIAHPEYHPPSKYNDIALLETEKTITFNVDVLPICLPLVAESEETAEATGWGALGHRQGLADTLQTVLLQRYDAEKCSQLYPKHRHLREGYNHSSQMCYGDTQEAKDTCEGDSGGPLQTANVFLRCAYTVLGVTSYGRQCGVSAGSGMYTRVYHYVPWIESIVWP